MSTLQNNQAPWTTLAGQQLDPKYEKCRNITEEIYKRINITFQIKKLESGEQSDLSDNSVEIDSNELSNETDLFACDKSDISSSTDAEKKGPFLPVAVINNNNNEERKPVIYKRPKKRFRKRVKKRAARGRSESEGSSDEAPLSRSLLLLSSELKTRQTEKPRRNPLQNNMTLRELLKPDDIKVPTVIIKKINTDNQNKTGDNEKNSKITHKIVEKDDLKKKYVENSTDVKNLEQDEGKNANTSMSTDTANILSLIDERKKFGKDIKVTDWKSCSMCNLSFRGERGLRRHMSMSHVEGLEGNK